jgi:hypothetical protein
VQAGSTRAGMAQPPPCALPEPSAHVRRKDAGSAGVRSAEHIPDPFAERSSSNGYNVLTSWISFTIDALASPNSMTVFGL